jgi:SAM-dependent methyltransferase
MLGSVSDAPPGDPFEGKAAWFDDQYRSTARGRVRLQVVLGRLLDRLPAPPASVLDAGGGTGAFAIPLAERGYRVTLLDPSEEWLGIAARRAATAGVRLELVRGLAEDAAELVERGFDAILCHTVLVYAPDPAAVLSALRRVAAPGGMLSALEKNREALPIRPGIQGDYSEARRVLDDPLAAGRLGIVNRSLFPGELRALLLRTGWVPEGWVGVRLFSDTAPEALEEERFDALLHLEGALSGRDPYRRVSRLCHLLGHARPEAPPTLEEIQRESFARAGAGTRASFPRERALTGSRLDSFLDRKHYATLSTTRRDGRPHAAMVGFSVRDGRLWVPSVAGAVRLANLAREPSASLVVTEGEGDSHTVVIVEGDALVHHDQDAEDVLAGWMRDEWRDRFGTELDWAGAVIELFPRKVLSYAAAGVR